MRAHPGPPALHLAHPAWLVAVTVAITAALAVGLVVICVLRASAVEFLGGRGPRLAASWGAVGMPAGCLAGLIGAATLGEPGLAGAVGGAAGTAIFATTVAWWNWTDRKSARQELRWRRGELRRIRDELSRWRLRWRLRGRLRMCVRRSELIIGEDRRGRPIGLESSFELVASALVCGAPGTGKTLLLLGISAIIANHSGFVWVDGKPSKTVRSSLAALAKLTGRPFVVFEVMSERGSYNPLAGVDRAAMARDLIMRILRDRYDEAAAVFRSAFSNRLLLACRVILDRGDVLSLARIAEVCAAGALLSAARGGPWEAEAEREAEQERSDSAQRSGVVGGLSHLREIVAPVDGRLGGAGAFSLADLFGPGGRRPIVYLSLASESYPELSGALGALIVQDLQILAGRLIAAGRQARTVVILDEAPRYLPEAIVDFAAQSAREAALGLILVTQSSRDLDAVATRLGERFCAVCAWVATFKLPNPADADYAARLAVQRPQVEATHQRGPMGSTGLSTAAAGHAWRVHPMRIQLLRRFEALLIRVHREDARLIRTWSPARRQPTTRR
jgi:energy-coupling factor transporter ATP-binding protein EcfA2